MQFIYFCLIKKTRYFLNLKYYETIAFLGAGNDFLDQHPDFSGEKTASDSYFHGGFGTDEMYFTAGEDHIGVNSDDYLDGFKPTNQAILTEQGNSTNIANVGDSEGSLHIKA